MQLVARIFNQGTLKLLAALAIPTSIGWFFYSSQQQAKIEWENYQKEQKEHPTVKSAVVNNYGLKEVDDGNSIRWQLTAKTGTMTNTQDVVLEGVKVVYYDAQTHAMKMSLQAPYGTANQATRFVKLRGDKGQRIVAEGQGGKSRFECSN